MKKLKLVRMTGGRAEELKERVPQVKRIRGDMQLSSMFSTSKSSGTSSNRHLAALMDNQAANACAHKKHNNFLVVLFARTVGSALFHWELQMQPRCLFKLQKLMTILA